MSNYKRGRNLEYHVKHEMEKEGYQIVVRSAGSHGEVDIVAIRGYRQRNSGYEGGFTKYVGDIEPEVWLIQCKIEDNGRTNSEKEELIRLAKENGCNAAWWSKNLGRVNLVVRD